LTGTAVDYDVHHTALARSREAERGSERTNVRILSGLGQGKCERATGWPRPWVGDERLTIVDDGINKRAMRATGSGKKEQENAEAQATVMEPDGCEGEPVKRVSLAQTNDGRSWVLARAVNYAKGGGPTSEARIWADAT